MCTILVQQLHIISLLGMHNLNSMAARYQLMYQHHGAHLFIVGVLAFTYHACGLSPKNPSALGPRRLYGIFTCTRPECTIHTTFTFSLIKPYIYMDFNTRIPRIHLRDPLTRPDHRTDLLHADVNVRSPQHRVQRSGPVQ